MARTKQMARKGNKGLPKATKGEKGRKGGKGGGGGVSSGRSGDGGSGGGGCFGGSDRNRNAKGNILSGRFSQIWKIDLLLQPLSGKSHMCGLSRK